MKKPDSSLSNRSIYGKQTTKIVEGENFRCQYCGKSYVAQKGYFLSSNSPLYQGNGGYFTICKLCMSKIYSLYVSHFNGDFALAAERVCQIFDVYYDEKYWEKVRANKSSTIINYIENIISEDNGRTYTDSFQNTHDSLVEQVEHLTEFKEKYLRLYPDSENIINEEYVPSKTTIRRFGIGFSNVDYETMQLEYDDWVDKHGSPMDKRQEELYTTICYMKLNLQRSVQAGSGNIGSLSSAYKSFIEAATTEIEDRKKKMEQDMENKPLGMLIRDIETFCPAEYYKDKKIYDDFDYLKDYVERFMTRPLRNLLTGSKDTDKEFSLQGDGDEQT